MSFPLLTFLLLLTSTVNVLNSEPTQDKAALLSFITQVPNLNRFQWNSSTSACSWKGVTCNVNQTAVTALRLPGVGLVGPIPPNTLGKLTSLRVLSLRQNGLYGQIPEDFSNLTHLYSLYLHENRFSGEFPATLTKLTRLTRLDLAGNNFTGEVPFSINNLTQLTGLFMQKNNFVGSLPSINIKSLVNFNVSYNKLNGSIPQTLATFPASSFAGNLQLCGGPLPPCTPFFPSPAPAPGVAPVVPSKKSKKLSTGAIVGIVIGSVLALLLLILLICCIARRRKRAAAAPKTTTIAAVPGSSTEVGMTSSSKELSGVVSGDTERNKLTFVGKPGGYSFDLEDLLRASAEVLGKGSVGTSYKAVLEDGTTVVVKRLKDVVVSKKEFDSLMEEIGRIENENLIPLRAYYFSKDEKLLVYDYMPAGSLSSVLHGSRGSGRTPLEWPNRMRIALAAGRGLSHLHTSAKTVHGNIKSSNVLLQQDLSSAALSDYGLNPLFSTSTPSNRVAGYRAPEVVSTRRPTYKSDVYSFGVLLLELLTGKAPNQASLGDEGIDLPRWVQSVVREEWTAEVFDVELMRYPNIEEEMVHLLQIAMDCVNTVPDSRPDIPDVVMRMEDVVNRTEGDPSDDPSKGGGSGGPTTPPVDTTP